MAVVPEFSQLFTHIENQTAWRHNLAQKLPHQEKMPFKYKVRVEDLLCVTEAVDKLTIFGMR